MRVYDRGQVWPLTAYISAISLSIWTPLPLSPSSTVTFAIFCGKTIDETFRIGRDPKVI